MTNFFTSGGKESFGAKLASAIESFFEVCRCNEYTFTGVEVVAESWTGQAETAAALTSRRKTEAVMIIFLGAGGKDAGSPKAALRPSHSLHQTVMEPLRMRKQD